MSDITLTDNDCLFGRGRAVVAHPGNVKFRQLIGRHKIGYTSLPRRRMKRAVMKQVIDEWRSQVPPGRFLKRDENGLLHEAPEEEAERKVAHGLRDHKCFGYVLDESPALLGFAPASADSAPLSKSDTETPPSCDQDGESESHEPYDEDRADPISQPKTDPHDDMASDPTARERRRQRERWRYHCHSLDDDARRARNEKRARLERERYHRMTDEEREARLRRRRERVRARKGGIKRRRDEDEEWSGNGRDGDERRPGAGETEKNICIMSDITLTENDCLFGQGRVVADHPGNVKYRQLIGRHKIVKQVIDEWKSQVPPGRFLNCDENGLLHEASQEEVERKVAAALRKDLWKRKEQNTKHKVAESSADEGTVDVRCVQDETPSLLGFASALADSAARSRSDTETPPSCDQDGENKPYDRESADPISQLKTDPGTRESECAGETGKNVRIIGDITLTENDCLFGRGNGCSCHLGNLKYRQLIGRHKIGYTSLRRRRMKRAVMKQVIDEWRAQVPPGRFLKRDENGLLHEASQEEVERKVAHGLRDKKWGPKVVPAKASEKITKREVAESSADGKSVPKSDEGNTNALGRTFTRSAMDESLTLGGSAAPRSNCAAASGTSSPDDNAATASLQDSKMPAPRDDLRAMIVAQLRTKIASMPSSPSTTAQPPNTSSSSCSTRPKVEGSDISTQVLINSGVVLHEAIEDMTRSLGSLFMKHPQLANEAAMKELQMTIIPALSFLSQSMRSIGLQQQQKLKSPDGQGIVSTTCNDISGVCDAAPMQQRSIGVQQERKLKFQDRRGNASSTYASCGIEKIPALQQQKVSTLEAPAVSNSAPIQLRLDSGRLVTIPGQNQASPKAENKSSSGKTKPSLHREEQLLPPAQQLATNIAPSRAQYRSSNNEDIVLKLQKEQVLQMQKEHQQSASLVPGQTPATSSDMFGRTNSDL